MSFKLAKKGKDVMAARSISIEEKIDKAQEDVARTKDCHDAVLEKLKRKNQLRSGGEK